MSAYHSPLDAYEEYIVRKRNAEAATMADTKEFSRDSLLTGAHLWWGYDMGQLIFWGLCLTFLGLPLAIVWWAYIQWRYHHLTEREKLYVRLHHGIGSPQPHYWWQREEAIAQLHQSA